MSIEEIARGESQNVEFKVSVSDKSENYARTVIAFANTQGGNIVFGVDDDRHVVGIDDGEETFFNIMDNIANAISDSCTPQIIPTIELQTLENKTVIVVNVLPGKQRPYYLKSKGKENGTFIRVGGTTRPAHTEKIKELELEGFRISWDELVCIGYDVNDKAVEQLLNDIKEFRTRADLPKREVTLAQLINWKVLSVNGKKLLPSNAFVLLTSDYFDFSKTQCAVFKGNDRSIFLDKREYTGPVHRQIEEAVNFVLRNIRLGARIEGLLRKEQYELPIEAIREAIINAHCHRNLTLEGCVQVAIYDDRLEVTSPGGLHNGLTYEDMMSGHSRIRNRVLANVFSAMGLVENWGTGIKRIMNACRAFDQPSFQSKPDSFCTTLPRTIKPQGTPSDGINENSDGVNANCDGINANCDGVNTDCDGINENSDGINTTSDGINANSDGVNTNCDGVNANSDGVNTNCDGVNTNCDGVNTNCDGVKFEGLNELQNKIVELLGNNGQLNAEKLSALTGITKRNIEKNLKVLKNKGLLIRHGSDKTGHWEVIKPTL